MRLEGKVALVTGSTRGIGRTIAEMFAEEGAKVVLSGRSVDKGEKNVQRIRDAGGEAMFVPLDVADETSVQDGGRRHRRRLRPDHDADQQRGADRARQRELQAGAPSCPPRSGTTSCAARVTSMFWTTKYTIPHMIEAGGGSIVNVSSGGVGVRRARARRPYSAAKGGVNSLTRVMAVEYGKQGIRCNTIIVGRVVSYAAGPRARDHEGVPARRRTRATSRYAALWLAADESEWITGSEITADGGARYNASEI